MILINYKDRRPIYEQIVDGMTEMIRRNLFAPGEQLPSVRSLAMELSLNPNTVQRAYTELEQKGIIYCVKGKGNFVADGSEIQENQQKELLGGLAELARKAGQLGLDEARWQQMTQQAWSMGKVEPADAALVMERNRNAEGEGERKL
ncbi:MAG: GntR family transcriptional regulator [Lachnospiraceae bacterium]|nr:GntR family transcriptional regulator [Lachnospiraceae bacterium]